jgi:hypothetical protein
MTESPITGACLCGAVGYQITGEILGFQYCHCSRCRKFTGSAHAANLFTAVEHMQWTKGESNVGGFNLDAEPAFATAFCKTCGSSMPSMSSSGKLWVIPAGALEQDPGAVPARSIFWESRASWYQDVSALPRFAEWPTQN